MANATLSKDEILDAIGNMSVFELAELIEAFKTKFNVTIAAAPVGGAAPAAVVAALPLLRPSKSRRSSPSTSRKPVQRRSRSSRSCAS